MSKKQESSPVEQFPPAPAAPEAATSSKVAELEAQIEALKKALDQKPELTPADAAAEFAPAIAEAEKAGFKAQVVVPLQKGASPALRIDL